MAIMPSMSTKQGEKNKTPKAVLLSWEPSESQIAVYSNQFVIGHMDENGGEFVLTFGQVTLPIILDPSKLPAEIDVKPVAKILVTPTMMFKLAEAINENVARYQEMVKKRIEGQGR